MKYSKEQREQAEKTLREVLNPGDTVKTILRHCSRSGMMRSISPIINGSDYSWAVARLLGDTIDKNHGGIKVSGCGMDMGFDLIHRLGITLFPNGFGCIGEGCPSSDHSNGDRDYTPHKPEAECFGADGTHCPCHREHWHKFGGYALHQEWL